MSQQLLTMAAAALAGSSNNPVDLSGFTSATALNNTVIVNFLTDGVLSYGDQSSPTQPAGQWHKNQPITGIGSDFDVRFTQNSGDAPAGSTLNTWLRINVTRGINYPLASGDSTGNFTVELRRHGGTAVLASATFTMTLVLI